MSVVIINFSDSDESLYCYNIVNLKLSEVILCISDFCQPCISKQLVIEQNRPKFRTPGQVLTGRYF